MESVNRRSPFHFGRTVCFIALVQIFLSLQLNSQTDQGQTSQTQTGSQTSSASTVGKSIKPAQPNCTNNGTYVNSKVQTVPRPETCSATPKGATAQCRDGTYSFSQSRRGTCSRHGGVGKWL